MRTACLLAAFVLGCTSGSAPPSAVSDGGEDAPQVADASSDAAFDADADAGPAV